MYYVTRSIEFDAAHRLMHHKGLCSNCHGHRYKVDLTLGYDMQLNKTSNLTVDFADIDSALKLHVLEQWDHALLLNNQDVLLNLLGPPNIDWAQRVYAFPGDPTAEVMASTVLYFMTCSPLVKHSHLRYMEATVWETPNCSARCKLIRAVEASPWTTT